MNNNNYYSYYEKDGYTFLLEFWEDTSIFTFTCNYYRITWLTEEKKKSWFSNKIKTKEKKYILAERWVRNDVNRYRRAIDLINEWISLQKSQNAIAQEEKEDFDKFCKVGNRRN